MTPQGYFSPKFLVFGTKKFEIAILVVIITAWVDSVFFQNFDFFTIFMVILTPKIEKKSIFPKSPKIHQNDPLGVFFAEIYVFHS